MHDMVDWRIRAGDMNEDEHSLGVIFLKFLEEVQAAEKFAHQEL
jgi:hypothetical protein